MLNYAITFQDLDNVKLVAYIIKMFNILVLFCKHTCYAVHQTPFEVFRITKIRKSICSEVELKALIINKDRTDMYIQYQEQLA